MAKQYCYNGVDISYANKNLDYNHIIDNYDFAYIRAGYGNDNRDALCDLHTKALCYNMPLGYYWFSYAYTKEMAEAEADYLCNYLVSIDYPVCLPLVWDYEYDSKRYAESKGKKITAGLIMEMWKAFEKQCNIRGCSCLLYTNADYYRNYFKGVKNLWLAYYQPGNILPSDIPEEYVTIKQYTSQGIDKDYLYERPMFDIKRHESLYEEATWVKAYGDWYLCQHKDIIHGDWYCDPDNGRWYWLKWDGKMACGEILQIGGEYYSFAEDGHMHRTNEDGALK